MAEYVVKMADERGRMLQQIEHGYSETEVRDRYSQQGFLVYSVKPRGMFAGGDVSLGGRRGKVKPAVSDSNSCRTADPQFPRIAHQTAEE